MYDYCFRLVKPQKVNLSEEAYSVPVVSSNKKMLKLKLSKDIYISCKAKLPQYTVTEFIPRFVYGGIKKGDCIGWIEVRTSDGFFIDKAYLVSTENADVIIYPKEQTFFDKILKFIEKDRR